MYGNLPNLLQFRGYVQIFRKYVNEASTSKIFIKFMRDGLKLTGVSAARGANFVAYTSHFADDALTVARWRQ